MILNAFILENIIQSFSFILIILVCGLIALILYLILKMNTRNRAMDKTSMHLNMLSNLFNNANVPCIIIKKDGRIDLINNMALNLFDKTKEEMEGTFFEAFSLISSSNKKTLELKERFKNNQRYAFDFVIKSKDRDIPCNFQVSEILSGKSPRYLVSIKEIEDEAQNRHNQNLLVERINELEVSSGLGYWIYDYETNETIWSRGLYNILGAKVNKVKPDLSFVSLFEDSSNSTATDLLIAIKNQKEYKDRLRIKDFNNNEKEVEIVLKHQYNDDNEISMSMGIMRDITETQKLTDQNNIARIVLNKVLNSEEIFMVITDDKRDIISLNDYSLETLNLPPSQIINNSFCKVFGDPITVSQDIKPSSSLTFQTHLPQDPDTIILWQHQKFEPIKNEVNNLLIGINLTLSAKVLDQILSLEKNEKITAKNS